MSHAEIVAAAKRAATEIVAKIPNLNTKTGVEELEAKWEAIHDLVKRNERMRVTSKSRGVQDSALKRSQHLREVLDQLRLLWPKSITSDPTSNRQNSARAQAEATFKAIKTYTAFALKPLQDRIAELERNVSKSSDVPYRGVFKSGDTYARGQFCTWSGCLWHANRETKSTPGDGQPDWTLAVKRGSDGTSAYGIAKKNGFAGNERDWLASLRAAK